MRYGWAEALSRTGQFYSAIIGQFYPGVGTAILDRILHHCVTVNIKGESYRLKERRRNELVRIDPKCMIKPEQQNGKVLSIPGEISLP